MRESRKRRNRSAEKGRERLEIPRRAVVHLTLAELRPREGIQRELKGYPSALTELNGTSSRVTLMKWRPVPSVVMVMKNKKKRQAEVVRVVTAGDRRWPGRARSEADGDVGLRVGSAVLCRRRSRSR